MIIGIGGNKQVGKNTASILFTKYYDFYELSFAHPLKQACAAALNLDYATFHDQDKKEIPFTTPFVFTPETLMILRNMLNEHAAPWDLPLGVTDQMLEAMGHKSDGIELKSPRAVMQFVGTEMVRGCVSNDFWTNAMALQMSHNPHDRFVITDVRFPDERAFVKNQKRSALIKICREGKDPSADSHVSETCGGASDEYVAIFQNNGTIDELHKAINEWFVNKGPLNGKVKG